MTTPPSDPDGHVLSLTYVSSVTRLLSVQQLVELIEQIRPKNERLGVTGLLLYSGGDVIQTLEGEPSVVETVFDTIRVDPRHVEVRVVDRRRTHDRAFSSWSMGFRDVHARDVHDSTSFADFVRRSVGDDLSPHASSALELLERFRVSGA